MFLIILNWVACFGVISLLAEASLPFLTPITKLEWGIYGSNYVLGLSRHFSEREATSNLLSINLDERVDNVNKQDDCLLHWQSVLASHTVWQNGALLINITQAKSTTLLYFQHSFWGMASACWLVELVELVQLVEWISLAPYKHADRGIFFYHSFSCLLSRSYSLLHFYLLRYSEK